MKDMQAPLAKFALTIDRMMDAPVPKVWRCWTEPKLLEQWFCPVPWRATDIVMDLRPGGEMTSTFRGPGGESFPNRGIFLQVDPLRRIVSTDAFLADWVPAERPFMVNDAQFEEAGAGRTHFVWRALHWNEKAMKEHEAMGFHDGWGKAADQLEALAKSL
jgi:uncharacterized protein YndB with AHSA1/START domain